jgi:gluconate 5-dehydrogenase
MKEADRLMRTDELFDIKNHVAIVTGSSSGLGYQMALGLAEAGAHVVVTARRLDLCRSICDDFQKRLGVDALPVRADVTREEDVRGLVETTLERFGKIDILVNNVGRALIKATLATTLDEWKEIMGLNVDSMFLCCREVGRHMIGRKYGKIINISSVYGFRGSDWRNYVDVEKERDSLSYFASKGAVIMFTRELASNWGRYNINVNAISPGCFFTDATRSFSDQRTIEKLRSRFPLGRWGEDDDLKGAVVFLASRASKYMTGHNLVVDGGWTSWC